jgi:putative ABC transport system substrate-binding protein
LAAQPKPRVARIGYLIQQSMTEPPSPERAAFLAGLREHGYEVGRNILIEYRSAENDLERLPELAAELVRQRVDLIVVTGDETAVAAKAASGTVPIVITVVGDVLLLGLARSYARPGGNVTGNSYIAPELGAKRVALIKEILPKARRVAVLHNVRNRVADQEWRETRGAGRQLGVALEDFPIDRADDVQGALDRVRRTRPDALLVIVDPRMIAFRKIIADAALRERIPCISGWREFVVSGALASYAPDFLVLFRSAARYVDRILKGAKPADLPIEQPTKFELVVNMKTAKALGLTIPQSVLVRADEVIQ